MNQDIILWIFGILITLLSLIIGGVIKIIFSYSERLTKLETVLSLLGEKAAQILHSPHTPDLDRLLEKYLDRNYELSIQEWEEMKKMCEDIEKDENLAKGERALAAWLTVICDHKIGLPPMKYRPHDNLGK